MVIQFPKGHNGNNKSDSDSIEGANHERCHLIEANSFNFITHYLIEQAESENFDEDETVDYLQNQLFTYYLIASEWAMALSNLEKNVGNKQESKDQILMCGLYGQINDKLFDMGRPEMKNFYKSMKQNPEENALIYLDKFTKWKPDK